MFFFTYEGKTNENRRTEDESCWHDVGVDVVGHIEKRSEASTAQKSEGQKFYESFLICSLSATLMM